MLKTEMTYAELNKVFYICRKLKRKFCLKGIYPLRPAYTLFTFTKLFVQTLNIGKIMVDRDKNITRKKRKLRHCGNSSGIV